jgi:hypothetical protein
MQASASGSMATSGRLPPPASTWAKSVTPAGTGSVRTATSLDFAAVSGFSRIRSRRSASANTTLGWLSCRAYSTSVAVHQAFMPTTAIPVETHAQ